MISLPTFYPVTSHTRHVGPGSTFVAIQGATHKGTDFIEEALKRGATTIIVSSYDTLSERTINALEQYKAVLKRFDNPRRALAYLSAEAAGFPAQKLSLVGIT